MNAVPDLVVVFGHENDRDEHEGLSEIARLRCEAAAELFRTWASPTPPTLLLTGAYGENFNATPVQHYRLLENYFIESAMRSPGITMPKLCGAPTSFTLEDVAYVRRFAIQGKFSRLRLITSHYHMQRVQFFARKLLPEFVVEYTAAPDPAQLEDRIIQREQRLVRELRFGGEWADVPLPSADFSFPNEIYRNAFEEHRHDDTVSYWLLGAGLSALVAAYVREVGSERGPTGGWVLIGSAVAGYLLFKLYQRYAIFARIARITARIIETIYFSPGFSYNHRKHHQNYGLGHLPTSAGAMKILVGLLIVVNTVLGLRALGCPLIPF